MQLKKLHIFNQYTGLQLETSKCEATRSLWACGNPLDNKNKTFLQEQINFSTFPDGTHIKDLPPNRSYIMLGVHINPMLDFPEHLTHNTKDFRELAKLLVKRKLSPSLKTLAVE